jgi:hypothetical protein
MNRKPHFITSWEGKGYLGAAPAEQLEVERNV